MPNNKKRALKKLDARADTTNSYRKKDVSKRFAFYPKCWEKVEKWKAENYSKKFPAQSLFEIALEKLTGIDLNKPE